VQCKEGSGGSCARTAGGGLWTAVVVSGQLRFSQNANQRAGCVGLWGFLKQERPKGWQGWCKPDQPQLKVFTLWFD